MSRSIKYHGFHVAEGGWWVLERVFADGSVCTIDESFDKQYIVDRCESLNAGLA